MTEGNSTYMGMAAPLNGEYEQKQINVASDMVTLTGKSGQTGDFLVAQDNSGTENFVITKEGRIIQKVITTPPTTGLTKGEMFLVFSNSSPVLALCTSTAGKTIKYLSPFDTKTLGRTT